VQLSRLLASEPSIARPAEAASTEPPGESPRVHDRESSMEASLDEFGDASATPALTGETRGRGRPSQRALQLLERSASQLRLAGPLEPHAHTGVAQSSKRVARRELNIETLSQQPMDAGDRPSVSRDARFARRPTQAGADPTKRTGRQESL
jgi:hypothetical protein